MKLIKGAKENVRLKCFLCMFMVVAWTSHIQLNLTGKYYISTQAVGC